MSSGKFYTGSFAENELGTKLAFIKPTEILIAEGSVPSFAEKIQTLSTDTRISFLPDGNFDSETGVRFFSKLFTPHNDCSLMGEAFQRQELARSGISISDEQSLMASAALLSYIAESYGGILPSIDKPKKFEEDILKMDGWTQSSLELVASQRRKTTENTLYNLLNAASTSAGRKELKSRILAPSTCRNTIEKRLDFVEHFVKDFDQALDVHKLLKVSFRNDLSLALQNISMQYGGAWHFGVVARCITGAKSIRNCLKCSPVASLLDRVNFERLSELGDYLHKILPEENDEFSYLELPKSMEKAGFLSAGCDEGLSLAKKRYIEKLEQQEHLTKKIYETFFSSDDSKPKIRLENKKPIGAFMEIECKTLPNDVVEDEAFIHLQTLGGSSKTKKHRFRNHEWSILALEIEDSYKAFLEAERVAFLDTCDMVTKERDNLMTLYHSIMDIDVSVALAKKSKENMWVRPKFIEQNNCIIKKGRHPVLESALMKNAAQFTPNNCILTSDKPISIITGPNMGGKSTFLRQNALIAIMAQIGCFVPAESAQLGIVDRIFSRVGSSDDIGKNQSSFMVEMEETAAIMNNATKKSLVLIDEVGRGTSSIDGSSLAEAIVHYIDNYIGCRTLFATHFHQVASKVGLSDKVENLKTGVEWLNGKIFFSHSVKSGISENSYGIEVAEIAGIPEQIVRKARELKQEKVFRKSDRVF